MPKSNYRHVVPNPKGGWDVKAPGASRASAHRGTRAAAEQRAKEIVGNLGGGEVRIHGRDGRIRDFDTVAPGNDPNPLRATGNETHEFDLSRPVYSLSDAAEILAVSRSTLGWWLEGGERRGRRYEPVLRAAATGDTSLTWPEFVEAGLLRQYRRELRVRLHEIRSFVAALREELGVAHPLAYAVPWVGEGRRLLVRFQELCELRGELRLIALVDGQPLLLPPADSFVKRVEWDGDRPVAWRPHDDEASPVRCRPDRRFGRPAIGGISTAAIVEHLDGGETETEVAGQFDLDLESVRWAAAYETSRVAAHAA